MSTIVSGTTTERIVRAAVMWVMVTVLGLWFLYDGYVGWPAENLTKAVEALNPVPDELPPIDVAITPDAVDRFREELNKKKATRDRLTRADLEKRFGQPTWEAATGDGGEVRYFGPAGVLRVALRGDLVGDAEFVAGKHDRLDLLMQRVLGYALLGLSLVFMYLFFRVISTRVVLDDEGLKIGHRRSIPLSAVAGLDANAYRAKGYVDVIHRTGDVEKRTRLDEYVIKELPAIVSAICAQRGFPNPIEKPLTPDHQ